MRLSLDQAMVRVCDALAAIGATTGASRRDLLAILAPEYDVWLSDEPILQLDIGPISLSRLVARAEQAFCVLGLSLADLAALLVVLAPEIVCSGTPGPTQAVPGSEAKVRALGERYDRREALFSRQDARLPERVGYSGLLDGNKWVRDVLVENTDGPSEEEAPQWSSAWWLGEEFEPPLVRVLPDQPARVRVARTPKRSRRAGWIVGRRGQLLLWDKGRRKRGSRPPKEERPERKATGYVWVQLWIWTAQEDPPTKNDKDAA